LLDDCSSLNRWGFLRLLHEDPGRGQRDSAKRVGVSMGAVNYCLKARIKRGWVKVGNLSASQNKLAYSCLLNSVRYRGEGAAYKLSPGAGRGYVVA
jgi:hypothetical protein